MSILFVFIANIICLSIFIHLAQQRAIIDLPNARSSHQTPTVRGGGLFFAPTFLFTLLYFFPGHYLTAIAILLVAIFSFIDDLQNLSYRIRLPLQFLSVVLLILDAQPNWSMGTLLLTLILITGWLNTFNFMDGINGNITVSGSIMLATFCWLHPAKASIWGMLEPYMIAALLAFAVFNFREKAWCFAGDVGSVSLALILAWFFLMHWQGASSLYLLLFPAVFAVDSVMTILVRLYRKENIFQAHRSHLYQLLANERGWDHRVVALFYGGLQLGINVLACQWVAELSPWMQLWVIVGGYLVLSGGYFLGKGVVSGGEG